jgi:hypothetical protein
MNVKKSSKSNVESCAASDVIKQNLILINRKFRVPRKQGAHFLGARTQIQDS